MNESWHAAPAAAREDLAYRPPPRLLPAWLGSLAVHFVALTTFAALVRETPRGLPGENPRAVGLALTHVDGAKTEYFGEARPEQVVGESSPTRGSAPAVNAAFPAAEERPAIGAAPRLPTRRDDLGSGLPGEFVPDAFGKPGNDSGAGAAKLSGGGSGAGETTVFGVRGVGTRFVYVFDRSASMSGFQGRPLAAAKRELVGSLAQLGRVHQFQILFYNDQPALMNPQRDRIPPLYFADEQNLQVARDYVERVVADGGTRHLEALKIALRLAPDVIFFLTDGDEPQLRPNELAEIQRLNHGTAIHAIEFGAGPKASRVSFLERIAEENDGGYTYVDVTKLPSAK